MFKSIRNFLERGKDPEERSIRRSAWRRSLPLILGTEAVGVILLIALYLFFPRADSVSGGADGGFDPRRAPAVDWPEPQVFLDEGSGRGYRDLPYEVSDGRGAVLLPDVFYADDFQNQQIMPTGVPLKLATSKRPYEYRVNRLIYPTIGNPALVRKAAGPALAPGPPSSSPNLRIVLRLKRPDYAHLGPQFEPAGIEWAPHLENLRFSRTDERNRIMLFLLKREQRNITESHTSTPINVAERMELKPAAVYIHDRSTVPLPLRGRDTIQFVFDQESLAEFEPGLYDLRLEIFQGGRLHRYEFQYNAARIFDDAPEKYSVLNITDSQVSLSELLDGVPNQLSFRSISHDKLKGFVNFAGKSEDELVKQAAFMTFNGDLHNGGSPGTLLPEEVAWTYNKEAGRIIEILRDLPLPIFLTPGNHDGYVSMGHVPGPIRLQIAGQFIFKSLWGGDKSLREVVEEARGGDVWKLYSRFLERTAGQPGGWHRDIFTGRFVRRGRVDKDGVAVWKMIPDNARNHVLYDGFYQWRKTYGPLFYSFNFGRSHYAVLNTYDLRQHRRSGWGMYTVNYGGGLSPFQMNWLRRDIKASEAAGRDITLIAHHDPRGGHNGEDHPYYFEMIEYTGMGTSAINYVQGEILNPLLCGSTPEWAQSKSDVLSCMHDGLQEWMRADLDFDCADADLIDEGPGAGFCDREAFQSTTFEGNPRRPEYSGYMLLHRLAKHRSIRTLLLGHTHYNSLEMLQPGDEIVPGTVTLDLTADKKYAKIEVANPLRRRAHVDLDAAEAEDQAEKDASGSEETDAPADRTVGKSSEPDGEQGELDKITIIEKDGVFLRKLDLLKSGHDFERRLQGKELAILRMTSMADLSLQQFQGRPLYGFSVLEVFPRRDRRAYAPEQINRVHYFRAVGEANTEAPAFERVASVNLERTQRWKRKSENPLLKLFRLPGSGEESENKPAERPGPDGGPAESK